MSRVISFATGLQPEDGHMTLYQLVAIEGRTCEEAAQLYDLAPERVSELVQAVERWIANRATVHDISAIRILHLQRLEHQWQEAMAGWHRSRQPTKQVRVDSREGAGSARRELRTLREQNGDIRFLHHAHKVMAEIRQIVDQLAAAAGKSNGEVHEAESRRLEILRICASIRQRLGSADPAAPRPEDR